MPNVRLSIPGFSIQHHQLQPPTATTIPALRGKTQPREKPRHQQKVGNKSAGWGCNKPSRTPQPPPALVTTPTSTAPTAGAAAGSGPQPWRDHAGWEREGSPLRAIRTQFSRVSYGGKKGGSVSDEHPSGSAPRSHSERGWEDARLVPVGALTHKWRDFAGDLCCSTCC